VGKSGKCVVDGIVVMGEQLKEGESGRVSDGWETSAKRGRRRRLEQSGGGRKKTVGKLQTHIAKP